MELSSQFRRIFKVIDANGDGKISSLELSEAFVCFDLSCPKPPKKPKQMDYNGNGFVDLDKFMDAIHDSDSKEDYLMDAFLIFYTDKNGLISAAELRRVLTNLGCDKCSVEECRRMIKGVKKDGDGFVDFEEFRSMMKTDYSK